MGSSTTANKEETKPTAATPAASSEAVPSSRYATFMKCIVACVFLASASVAYIQQHTNNEEATTPAGSHHGHHRRLAMLGETIPTYMEKLMEDLRQRKKLFDETPPEEIKYWFEYTGPLQVRAC
jgi:hypothetical protein